MQRKIELINSYLQFVTFFNLMLLLKYNLKKADITLISYEKRRKLFRPNQQNNRKKIRLFHCTISIGRSSDVERLLQQLQFSAKNAAPIIHVEL